MKKDICIHTGGDPRALPDYTALRDELMKLSHPARPDVDWTRVGQLCLTLFEHNGVDLQTAAWYTLARTHIVGLAGIGEGLALINALTLHQWSMLWPGSLPARVDIIAGLSQRLQTALRKQALNDRGDLAALYQVEKSLTTLTETLARHELKQACRIDILLQQVTQAITRLENMPYDGGSDLLAVLPEQAIRHAPEQNRVRVFVVRPEPQVQVAIADPGAKRRSARAFIAGVGSAVVVIGLLIWGWNGVHATSPEQRQLLASLTSLPEPLPVAQLTALRQTSVASDRLVEQTREQLVWLMSLPPDWPLRYGQHLVSQAQVILPGNTGVSAIAEEWQQQREAIALSPASLNSWHNGMTKLQGLTDRLNNLDEKRGKYMTVSELKSEVFAVTQAFNQHPPVEESLRLLAGMRQEKGSTEVQKQQSELTLRQLLARFTLLTQRDKFAE